MTFTQTASGAAMPFQPVERIRFFWTYIDWNGETVDLESETQDEAHEWAIREFCEQAEDTGVNQDEADIELVRFFNCDDTGERVIVERVQSGVEYEYYRGDRAEHGTWG